MMRNSNDNIEPGYLFPEGEISGLLIHGDEYEVSCRTNDGVNIRAILASRHAHDNMNLNTGRKIKNLVVLGKEKGAVRVACANYFDELCRAMYAGDGKNLQRMPFWEESWKRDCSEEVYPSNFRITGQPSCKYGIPSWQKWFEARGSSFILPVKSSRFIDSMDGHPHYCPLTAYTIKEKRSVYKMDMPNIDPFLFKATARLVNGKSYVDREIYVFLHGFVSPAKLHFGIWKHVCGIAPSRYPDDGPETWSQWTQRQINCPPRETFSRCKENKGGSSCNEIKCYNDKLFKEVHPSIKSLCKKYYSEIVTFFSTITSKYVYVYDESSLDHKYIKVVSVFGTKNSVIAEAFSMAFSKMQTKSSKNISDLKGRMVLAGASYDWKSSETPTLHLTPVTLYIGKNVSTYSGPGYEENRKPPAHWEIIDTIEVKKNG